jgi:3'-5' exoribonuclease
MKRKFVSELRAGDVVEDLFVLADKHMAQKKDGANYLNITVTDRTGSVRAVAWDQVEQISQAACVGDVVLLKATVSEYRGVLQLVVRQMTAAGENVDPGDFLPRTPRPIESMFDRLKTLTRAIQTPYIRALFDALWADADLVQGFKTAPAAKTMHHAYIGGLLEHSLSMALLTEKIAGHYAGVNADLLLAGAILHDIGKIQEFAYSAVIDYSDAGRLLSHIVLGLAMVDEKLAKVADFPPEEALLLKHLIVSHHGSREFGSPEVPKTIEAVLLNYIDEIDSKVNGIRDFMASEEPGQSWTAYHKLLGRHFYKGANGS